VRRSFVLAITITIAITFGASSAAHAADEACFTSYEDAQRLRRKNELARAKEAMRACLAPTCPPLLRADCAAWLAEAEAETPSLRIETDAKSPVRRATIDGTDAEVGALVVVDPGRHRIRVETTTGTREIEVDVSRGEKERRVLVSFAPLRPSGEPSPPVPKTERRIPASAWIAGGVSIAALATFGIVGGIARVDHVALDERCAPRCAPEESTRIETMYRVADVALVVSIVAATTAAILIFMH
jgi:hypothetical protein